MAATRKHIDSNQRINDAHERKELKEENQRLINLQNRNKRHVKTNRRLNFNFGDAFDGMSLSGYPA
jgi:hypothetical protein